MLVPPLPLLLLTKEGKFWPPLPITPLLLSAMLPPPPPPPSLLLALRRSIALTMFTSRWRPGTFLAVVPISLSSPSSSHPPSASPASSSISKFLVRRTNLHRSYFSRSIEAMVAQYFLRAVCAFRTGRRTARGETRKQELVL